MTQLLIVLAALGAATRYPEATDPHVNDFAAVLSANDVEHIRAVCQTTLRDRGVPIVVATIRSLADYQAANWSIERYATNLYNEWGIGDQSTNRGVLLLVSVRDRKLRIATGSGLSNLDGPARQVIDGIIVRRFKSGDMSGGIRSGVDAIAQWFGPLVEVEQSPTAATAERVPGGEGAGWRPHGTPIGRSTGFGGFGCFFWIILLFVGFAVLSRIARGGGRRGGYYGGGSGGWGRFLLGGLAGFLGSQLLQGGRGRRREWDSSGSFLGGRSSNWSGGGGSGGGSSGGSSFGGGFSSGGGASGSW